MASSGSPSRGCVFYNFGTKYALRLIVSIYSLRKYYSGPITLFTDQSAYSERLIKSLAPFAVDFHLLEDLSKSFDRHRLVTESPYVATLVLDSDMIFMGPIDALWEPLEREGVLATRFYAPPYGVDGTAEKHGWGSRDELLRGVEKLVPPHVFEAAMKRLHVDRIDVNVGLFGVSKVTGGAFLSEWIETMEKGRSQKILLLDEMTVVALLAAHRHFLADEIWNCPADEFFRRTNLSDARVIHYFADGDAFGRFRLGRNPNSWAGAKWYQLYSEASEKYDLTLWRSTDPTFAGFVEMAFSGKRIFRKTVLFRRWQRHLIRLRYQWNSLFQKP